MLWCKQNENKENGHAYINTQRFFSVDNTIKTHFEVVVTHIETFLNAIIFLLHFFFYNRKAIIYCTCYVYACNNGVIAFSEIFFVPGADMLVY